MSIWIFVVLLFISAVLSIFSIIVLDEDTEFGGCLFVTVVAAVFIISAVSTVGFLIGRQEVVTSEETELPPPTSWFSSLRRKTPNTIWFKMEENSNFLTLMRLTV